MQPTGDFSVFKRQPQQFAVRKPSRPQATNGFAPQVGKFAAQQVHQTPNLSNSVVQQNQPFYGSIQQTKPQIAFYPQQFSQVVTHQPQFLPAFSNQQVVPRVATTNSYYPQSTTFIQQQHSLPTQYFQQKSQQQQSLPIFQNDSNYEGPVEYATSSGNYKIVSAPRKGVFDNQAANYAKQNQQQSQYQQQYEQDQSEGNFKTYAEREYDAREMFRRHDNDNNGFLDIYEFLAAMNELGAQIVFDDAKVVFSVFDDDAGHSINEDEFVNHVVTNYS